jgi:antitoxin component YwqK of YwqJK toxin-antitoxin module
MYEENNGSIFKGNRMLKEMPKDQVRFCLQNGEFAGEILSSSQKVAVFLTQSWCPQWHEMKLFIGELPDCSIYVLEYDRTDYFDDFRVFKEEVFKNDQIPYIRYYEDGKLIDESNAVSKEEFCRKLGLG